MSENCPYCNAEIEICHDDGYGYEESVTYEQECWKCKKTFTFTTLICFYYDLQTSPCLNGDAEHDLKPVWGAPKELFEGVKECTVCGTRVVDEEMNRAARKRYLEKLQSNENQPTDNR